MSRPRFAIRFAIWHPRMGDPRQASMARTNRIARTNATDARYQDQSHHLQFLNARVGLWITRISSQEVTA
jgi:hypothetical protein